MHLIELTRSCIDQSIRNSGTGMKAMILDDFTTNVIGLAFSRSEMLLREVYLIENIESISESKERLNNLKCIVILRPTNNNIRLLCQELNHPHYRTYNVYFTLRLDHTFLKMLAESDEREVVRTIGELSLDFLPTTPFAFNLELSNQSIEFKQNSWLPGVLERTTEGIMSILLGLQIHPIIRYSRQSNLCKLLARTITDKIKTQNLSHENLPPIDQESLLLILDRRQDLITPIIHSWNYATMIHEEFKVRYNRVNLENVPDRQPKDPKEMLLSIENDQFYKENFDKIFGEIGPTLLEALELLKSTNKTQKNLETLADMKRFIEEYPENKKYATDLHNHVFLMTELSRIVSENNLMPISECEQEIVCDMSSLSQIVKKMSGLICSSKVRGSDALRLVCLFMLCQPDKSKELGTLTKLLRTRTDITKDHITSIQNLRSYNMSKQRNPLDDTVSRVTRKIKQGVKGVDNVLTEFSPALSDILVDLKKVNKSKDSDLVPINHHHVDVIPKRVIVYMVGGYTFDEAITVHSANKLNNSQFKVIIGGSSILNFETFIDRVIQTVAPDIG